MMILSMIAARTNVKPAVSLNQTNHFTNFHCTRILVPLLIVSVRGAGVRAATPRPLRAWRSGFDGGCLRGPDCTRARAGQVRSRGAVRLSCDDKLPVAFPQPFLASCHHCTRKQGLTPHD